MRVLQIVKTNIGATWAFNQAKWLHKHGVDIITVLPSIQGGMADRYRELGMKVIKGELSLPVSRPWKILSRIKEVNRLINHIQPDIIHCHFVTNSMMLRIALRNSKIPRLFQVPGPLHLESFLFRKAEMMLSKKNDYWIGTCKKTCSIYRESKVNEEQLFLSYYGNYTTSQSDQYIESQNILHEEYEISNNSILVGMVSYFYKPKWHLLQFRGLKGHEDFIDAISLVREKNPTVIGVVIGDAWGNAEKYVERVKKYAYQKCPGGIIFTGFRTDMKKIYRELNIAVHPSHSENLGGASESLAAGVPTISSNIGGFPDIVIDGKTGYTVPIKSPSKLANAIEKMIDNPIKAKVMSEKGKEIVTKLLDIENTGDTILNIYNKILDRNKK